MWWLCAGRKNTALYKMFVICLYLYVFCIRRSLCVVVEIFHAFTQWQTLWTLAGGWLLNFLPSQKCLECGYLITWRSQLSFLFHLIPPSSSRWSSTPSPLHAFSRGLQNLWGALSGFTQTHSMHMTVVKCY